MVAGNAIMPVTGEPMDIRNAVLGFSFGVVLAHWLPMAQSLWACCMGAGVAIAVARRARVLGAALVGIGWGGVNALDALERRVDPDCVEVTVHGRVAGLPSVEYRHGMSSRRFVFVPEDSGCGTGCGASCGLRGALRLIWLDGPSLRGGERWSLDVRLKPPRAGANMQGFDAEAWFARDKVAATGYVRGGTRLDGTDVDGDPSPGAIRQGLRDRLGELPLVHGDVLAALTLGHKGAIPSDKLDLYRRTGTMHLLVISGLHVGIVTAFGFLAGRAFGQLTTLSPRACGVVAALALSGAYVVLAGSGLSLVRAFAMSVAGMVALIAGRPSAPSGAFAYALGVVLLVDPMAPLSAGLWLSFGAVAVLLGFFVPRPRRWTWLISAVLAQLAIATVFVPATTGITGLVHPLGIGVNLVAVPTVTLLVVPFALAGVASIVTPIGPWLLTAADFVVHLLEVMLATADRIAPLYVADHDGWHAWIVAAAAAGLLPVSRIARGLLLATVVVMLFLPQPTLPRGQVAVTVLDVGQGTAVLVETANHTMIYDTGPAFPSGRDSGTGVVLPAVRGRGWGRVDRLVLSHGDVDHIGGAASVLDGLPVGQVLVGEAISGIKAHPCSAGLNWHWDGVRFSILSPPTDHRWTGNNASCVVLIETASRRVLLAGDIEAIVEGRLRPPLVDVLLVPHHGSATSSTPALVAATKPKFAVVAAGFDNRFGHPHPQVVQRYRNTGSHIVSTALAGAVRWRSSQAESVIVQRCSTSPYWRLDRSSPSGTDVACDWLALGASWRR